MKTTLLLLLLTVLPHKILYAQSRTYILVHGAWHGAWAWKKVVPLLTAGGHKALAVNLPGSGEDQTPAANITLDDCVNKVVDLALAQTGAVTLVGHWMAGVVIAQAAEKLGKEKVSKLVFVDAFMPQNGESVFALAEKARLANKGAGKPEPNPSVIEALAFSSDQKTSTVKPDFIRGLFYDDCTEEDLAFAKAHLGPQSMQCLSAPVSVTDARYGAIPKIYILCTKARDLDKSSLAHHVPIQKIHNLESSHSPFFAMPEKLAAILMEP